MTTCVIDQHSTHHVGCRSQKVRPALPIHLALVDEPQIHLMDERGWLQSVLGALGSQMAGRRTPQLGVDERHQPVECTPVAPVPIAQERRNVVRGCHLVSREAANPKDTSG
jgi:hypothetical protein